MRTDRRLCTSTTKVFSTTGDSPPSSSRAYERQRTIDWIRSCDAPVTSVSSGPTYSVRDIPFPMIGVFRVGAICTTGVFGRTTRVPGASTLLGEPLRVSSRRRPTPTWHGPTTDKVTRYGIYGSGTSLPIRNSVTLPLLPSVGVSPVSCSVGPPAWVT